MCLILDANKCDQFVENGDDMKPIREWVEKKGKIAYSPTDKFKKELNKGHKGFREIFRVYSQSGKISYSSKDAVQKIQNELEALKGIEGLKSDDPHIIALAQVSGTTLLVSEDRNLHADFKNKKYIKGGYIYQDASHKHLLIGLKCP